MFKKKPVSIKKLREDAKIPTYAHKSDAGLDLCVSDPRGSDALIEPGAKAIFNTGLSIALPAGHVGLVWDKSGIASKTGLKVMGGVIDEGYRGEISVIVYNTSNERVAVKNGQKIAQLLIQKVENPEIKEVDELPSASDERGSDGFGSTGV